MARYAKTCAAALWTATLITGCGSDTNLDDARQPDTQAPDDDMPGDEGPTPQPPGEDTSPLVPAEPDDKPPVAPPAQDAGPEQPPEEEPPQIPAPKTFKPIKVGILPDTQASGDKVAVHPMKAVLDKFEAEGVNVVIPVGDLTDYGSSTEFASWVDTAREFRERGMEFLPLMGNHEDSYAYGVEWVDFMQEFLPEDARHLNGAQYVDYYVVRENVLLIMLRYYHLPVAFPWIKKVVAEQRENVDHIIIASHDGLIGAKYGETREMIVEGTAGDNRLFDQWDDIRAFFSEHDVVWVQGHEHMYQRSIVRGPVGFDLSEWKYADGPYRLPMYTQIFAGNASHKGYEFRYGERELVQSVIQQKMGTLTRGSNAYDANATVLAIDNKRIDLKAFYTEHTINSHADGPKELANPDWKLFDKFSRTTKRCERLVFPNSMPSSMRPVLQYDAKYWTNDCVGSDGSAVRILDGINDTFNRVESTTRSMSFTPGFSRAQSQAELMRLAYQFLFQYHESWTPNLNGNQRLVADPNNQYEVTVPETTIDLKEHLTLSWLPKSQDTASDILIVSGTQNHTGTFSSAYGAAKDIEVDDGLPGSQPDGTAKRAVVLPDTATKKWDISDAVADAYTLQFALPEGVTPFSVRLGHKTAEGFVPFASDACVLHMAYEIGMLNTPPVRPEACASEPLIGFDETNHSFWVVLTADAEVALLSK